MFAAVSGAGMRTAVGLALVTLSSPSYASESTEQTVEITQVEEVTVFGRRLGHLPGATATKTGTALLETPFSVSIASRELLNLRGVANIGEAVETLSGVTRTIGFSGNQSFRIRGFPAISYLRDGFRQSTSQPEVELQGIESIETLKGPASALYGRFEPGGVINFVSKRPQSTFASDFSATAGSYEYGRVGLDVTGPMDREANLLGRINVAYENADSFRELVDNEQLYVAPAVEYRLGAATTLLGRLEYLERDTAFDRGLGNDPAFLRVPIERNYGEEFMRLRKRQWSGALELNHQIGDEWRLRAGAFYSRVRVPEEEFFNYGFPALAGSSVNRNFSSYQERQDDGTVQAELYGTLRTGALSHRLLFGTEYTYDRLEYLDAKALFGAPRVDLSQPTRTGRPPDASYFVEGDSSVELGAAAIYAQDEIAWRNLRVLLGGRYERAESDVFRETGLNPGVTRTDRPFSPRAGVTWLLTEDVSLYGSWSKSFRTEGSGGLLRRDLLPEPTRGEQWEAGIKLVSLDSRLETSLAVFDLTKNKAIVGDPDDFNYVIQVGELASRGAEAEVSAKPLPVWTLAASYTYADTEIVRDTNAFIVGNRLAGVPRHRASLWTSWAVEDGLLRGLTLGGGVFYASEQAATTANNYFLPSYVRVDLNAVYEYGEGYEVRLNLDNVTDERIYITGGFSQIYPQAPVSARVTFTKRWR